MADVIVRDHQSSEHSLDAAHCSTVKNLIAQRINWSRTAKIWKETVTWCDLMIGLLSSKEQPSSPEFLQNVKLAKAHALLLCDLLSDSLQLASECAEQSPSTYAIVLLFRVTLMSQGKKSAIQMLKRYSPDLIAEHRKRGNLLSKNTASTFSNELTEHMLDRIEDLDRLLVCFQVSIEAQSEDDDTNNGEYREDIASQILLLWLSRYEEGEVWKSIVWDLKKSPTHHSDVLSCPSQLASKNITHGGSGGQVEAGSDDPRGPTSDYVSVTCDLLQRVLNSTLSVRCSGEKRGSDEGDIERGDEKGLGSKRSSSEAVKRPRESRVSPNNQQEAFTFPSFVVESADERPAEPEASVTDMVATQDRKSSSLRCSLETERSLQVRLEEQEGFVGTPVTSPHVNRCHTLEGDEGRDAQLKSRATNEGADNLSKGFESANKMISAVNDNHEDGVHFSLLEQFSPERMTKPPMEAEDAVHNKIHIAYDATTASSEYLGGDLMVFGDEFPPKLKDSTKHYEIKCSLEDFRKATLLPLMNVLKVIGQANGDKGLTGATVKGYKPSKLLGGTDENVRWLADLGWSLGCLMLSDSNTCVFKGNKTGENADNLLRPLSINVNDYEAHKYSRKILASQYFEAACGLYDICGTDGETHQAQIFSLVISSAARMDASAIKSHALHNSVIADVKVVGDEVSKNMDTILSNLTCVQKMLRQQQGFENALDRQLSKVALVLEFAALCRVGSDRLGKFVENNQNYFLQMSAAELQSCSGIAAYENGGDLVVARQMLELSLEANAREGDRNYALAGDLYFQLIQLSQSRQHVRNPIFFIRFVKYII